MKKVHITTLMAIICILYTTVGYAQLSDTRVMEIADIKVERFQNILDLSPAQAKQLHKETITLLKANGEASSSQDIVKQINANLEQYYKSLTTLAPQQLSTLRLFDGLERSNRREAYQDLMQTYGQSSEFGTAMATYYWNIAIPILTSYRKDLDRYISSEDQATIAAVREELLAKYNFITNAREQSPSVETESIVSEVQAQLLSDIQSSHIPKLLKKYDERINTVRASLKSHETKISNDIKDIYALYVTDNHKMQMDRETEFISTLGISKLMRDSFFLLMDGDSRATSFKINALHLMANESQTIDQF